MTRSNPANPLGMTGSWTQFQLDATSAGCNLTAPLGGVECTTRVPFGGVEWHEILRQLGILQSLRHSVASSARRACHSVASSGTLEKMLARPDNVDTAGPELPLLQIGLRTLGLAINRRTRPCPNPAASAHVRRAHAPATPMPKLPQTHVRGAQ